MSCAYCKNITVCAICGKGYAEAVHSDAVRDVAARPTSVEVLGLAEDYGQWMWDAGFLDDPSGDKLIDNAAIRRDEIKKALEADLHNAYAEGRKDQAEEQPMPQKALELLDEALAFTQSIWHGELNDKDDREGLAFNLRCRLREYLIEVGHTHAQSAKGDQK